MASIKDKPARLNLRSGLFRLWVFGSVIWMAWVFITWPNKDADQFGPYIEYQGFFTRSLNPAWKAANETLYVPNSFEMGGIIPWRGTEVLWVQSQDDCAPDRPKDGDICARFLGEFKERDAYRRGEYFRRALSLALVPPALIAALLLGLGWVISGFSPRPGAGPGPTGEAPSNMPN